MAVEHNPHNITSMLINNFVESTVEFLWEEYNQVTLSGLSHCIILSCILLNFNSFQLEHQLQNKTIGNNNLPDRKLAYEFILEAHVTIFWGQRLSSQEFLLFSDFTFPSVNRNTILNFAYGLTGARERHRKYPSVIISTTLNYPVESVNPENWQISVHFSLPILLFVSQKTDELKIGYVPYTNFHVSTEKVQLVAVPITQSDLSSQFGLRLAWERLHSTTRMKTLLGGRNLNCLRKRSSYSKPIINYETCGFKESYCQHVNCSTIKCCQIIHNFLSKQLSTPSYQYTSYQIFPFVQKHIDFKIQILFPKENIFDTNLTAFLYPFHFLVWLSCVIAMICVSAWLILCERQVCYEILFWQPSTILEQDPYQLKNVGSRGTSLVGLWLLSLFLIRQFYGSSLYSFMTTENEPNDFPNGINETLSRTDFYLLCSYDFQMKLFQSGIEQRLPLFNFYLEILRRSYLIIYMHDKDFESDTLRNLSNGRESLVYSDKYKSSYSNSTTIVDAMNLASLERTKKYVRFDRFVVICEEGCMENPGLLGQTRLIRKISDELPVLRSHQFWHQNEPSSESFRFEKFLGSFVESGLYELEIQRFKKLNQLRRLKKFESSKRRVLNNGSLFSYVFLDVKFKKQAEKEKFEEPMKIVALKGTLILVQFFVFVAIVTFLVELWKDKDVKYADRINHMC
ncbi:unnamed protein product [Orchesella dallaii]|uniref:Uncharacterized protein n=1 Tax=Orchesella dallaii TaxID=48710 RepID=A0ABP1RGQ1_9HEXA